MFISFKIKNKNDNKILNISTNKIKQMSAVILHCIEHIPKYYQIYKNFKSLHQT